MTSPPIDRARLASAMALSVVETLEGCSILTATREATDDNHV